MLLKFKVIAGALWNALNSGVSFLISMGTIAVLARWLKPEDFGLFAMISVVIGILESFSDMGVSAAVISYKDIESVELSALFYFNIFIGLLLTLLLILLSPVIVAINSEPRIYPYLWLMAAYFTITAPATLFNVLMKKQMQFDVLSKINMVTTLIYAVTVIVYAYFSRDVMSLVVGMLVQALVGTILNVYFGLRLWRPQRYVFHYRHIQRFVSFGLYQMGSRIINRFNQNIDYLLIGSYLGTQALGYYSMAYNLMVKPIQRINPIIAGVAFPALVQVSEDEIQLKRYYLKMIRYICYIMVPIYILFFVFSVDIIVFLYGAKWQASVPVLQVLSFLGIFYALGNPMGNLILSRGRADIGFYNDLSKTLIFGLANFIGLQWGITGVAWSTLITIVLVVEPVNFWLRYYLSKMRVMEYLDQIYKPLLFSGVAAGLLVLGRDWAPALAVTTVLMVGGSVFFILYIIQLFLFDQQEWLFLRRTVREFLANRRGIKAGGEV